MGQYYPRHDFVLPLSPKWIQSLSKRVTIFDEAANCKVKSSPKTKPLPISIKDKVKGFVTFSKQLGHEVIKSTGSGPNEARFEKFNDNPTILTNYK